MKRLTILVMVMSAFCVQIAWGAELTREEKLEEASRLYQEGKLLVGKGDYKAANQAFLKAQEILKKEPLADKTVEEAQDLHETNAIHEELLQRADKLYNEAVIYIRNEEFKKAQSCLEEAVKINPNDKDAYYNLGILYEVNLKDKREAAACYLRYVLLEPDPVKAEKVKQWLRELKKGGAHDD